MKLYENYALMAPLLAITGKSVRSDAYVLFKLFIADFET